MCQKCLDQLNIFKGRASLVIKVKSHSHARSIISWHLRLSSPALLLHYNVYVTL